jgi:hypothetical protein
MMKSFKPTAGILLKLTCSISAYMGTLSGTLSTQMSHSLLEYRKGYIATFFSVAVHSKQMYCLSRVVILEDFL